MLRFLHITDTHIGPDESFSLYGRQPLQYLRRLVDEINALPFPIEFVLHTGDVVDDRSAAAYLRYEEAIDALSVPVYHVAGNHDDARLLQSVLMNIDEDATADRLDYAFDVSTSRGQTLRCIVLDTRGPVDPGGRVEPEQLDWLRDQLNDDDGVPLVLALHHSIVPLDTPWLDTPPAGWGGRFMYTENAGAIREAISAARGRIRCVLSGHVHGLFVVERDGILFVPGQSVFAGLINGPHAEKVAPDPDPRGHYNLVTLTEDGQTIIRPQTFSI